MAARKKPRSNLTEARRKQKRRASSVVGYIQHSSAARFGAALKERRLNVGVTQAELAERTGLNRSYISEVECGRASISLDRAEKLARAVECFLSDLLRDE